MSQIGYIPKKVWIISVILLLIVMVFSYLFKVDDLRILWAASAMVPILVLVTITEITCSTIFGMNELEMTARFNLRSLVLARMGILGTGNLALFLITIPVLSIKLEMESVRIGVFLLVPYLLTCFISFVLVNRFHSGEITYYCAGAAVLVWCLEILLNCSRLTIYEHRHFSWWLVVLAVLLTAVIREIYIFIKNTEEFIWSSYLTA